MGIFEPMGDVEMGLLRGMLFMFWIWEERPLPFVNRFFFLCFSGSGLFLIDVSFICHLSLCSGVLHSMVAIVTVS